MNPEEMMPPEGGSDLTPEQIQEMMAAEGGQMPPEEGGMPPEMEGLPEGMPEDEMMGMEDAPPPPPEGMESPLENQGIEDPREMLSEVANQYMDFAIGVKNDNSLDMPLRAQIMVQMAQALNYLVPLLKDDGQADLMMKQAEMELKQEEHQMNMEMKQAEMEFKKQELQLNMEMKTAESQMKLQQSQQQNQLKMQQQQEQHIHKTVQSQESHQTKMEQQKQAAQVKQSSNHGSKGAKK